MDPIQLPSGAELTISELPFKPSQNLMKAIIRELIAVKFDLDLNFSDLSDISGKDIDTLKNAILQVAQSDAVEAALTPLMERFLYNGQRIDMKSTFNPRDARADYYPVVWEVIKEAVFPFFGKVSFVSLIGKLAALSAPRSKSQSPTTDLPAST